MTQPEARQPTADELGAALNPKHRALAEAYLQTFSVTRAGKLTTYKDASNAHRVYRRQDVQAYIQARMTAACMTANEVLARLSVRASLSGDDFFEEQEYEVPVYEARPLQEKIDHLEAQVGQMLAIDPGVLKDAIASRQAEIATLSVQLALDPEATWQQQVGTEMKVRMVPSLEAAQRNGVLQFVEGAEFTKDGLKFKWADPVRALELIGKHHKLFTEKHEHSGSVEVLGIDYLLGGSS